MDVTLRERWQNILADWSGVRRTVVRTAVGWNPGGWAKTRGRTASGNREYSVIVREGEAATEEIGHVTERVRRAVMVDA
jgi:hypothetical protein